MTFSSLGLCEPILDAVSDRGYQQPTPIQRKAIPLVLQGRDIFATAQTGSGKTASFVLPIVECLKAGCQRRAKRMRALILVPTRELALQVTESIDHYAKGLPLKAMSMVGGTDSEQQKQQLIDGVDIVVATPGRLLDLLHQRALYCDELKFLVLDEADRMLDMGFIADITKVIDRLPANRQTLLFSATSNREVRSLVRDVVIEPVELTISADSQTKASIDQWLVEVDKDTKSSLLSYLINEQCWSQALIFIRTKHGAAKLVSQLEKRGIRAESIHSGRSQAMRTQILADFKSGSISLLVATGIAARGIDIEDLDRVVNYDLPDDADEYIHRIGRTGRAGASGEAVSLVSKDDFKRLCAIERRLDQVLERRAFKAFLVNKALPSSSLDFVSRKPATKKAAPKDRSRKPRTEKKAGAANKPAKGAANTAQSQPKQRTASATNPAQTAKPEKPQQPSTAKHTQRPEFSAPKATRKQSAGFAKGWAKNKPQS